MNKDRQIISELRVFSHKTIVVSEFNESCTYIWKDKHHQKPDRVRKEAKLQVDIRSSHSADKTVPVFSINKKS